MYPNYYKNARLAWHAPTPVDKKHGAHSVSSRASTRRWVIPWALRIECRPFSPDEHV